jgi:hypothetical protein
MIGLFYLITYRVGYKCTPLLPLQIRSLIASQIVKLVAAIRYSDFEPTPAKLPSGCSPIYYTTKELTKSGDVPLSE